MSAIDHVAIAAATLEDGAAAVAAALGVGLEGGGRHAAMSTHNRLLSLGPAEYLEVIAPDPDAPPPGRARWFALDAFAGVAAARAWVVAVPDLEAALAVAPPGAGQPMDFTRGDLSWRMAVPDDGWLPFDGLFPALIQWTGGGHPAGRLPDRGARLAAVALNHPDAGALEAALRPVLEDARVRVAVGRSPTLRIAVDTAGGQVWL